MKMNSLLRKCKVTSLRASAWQAGKYTSASSTITIYIYIYPPTLYCLTLTLTLTLTELIMPFFTPTAGGSEWASGLAGVCWKRYRACEASWILPSLQGDRPQHHSVQRGGHWWHNCHWGVPWSKHQHDTSVRTFFDIEIELNRFFV